MTRLPRLLPLLAVAAVGVLAVNALENGPGIVGAARGFAEEVGKGHHKGGKAPADQGDSADTAGAPDASNAAVPASAVVAAKPAPVCAPSPTELAQEAGLSPAELQVLQSLGARRGELDQREQGLDTQVSLIAAAEAKVDARIATMNALKADMQTLLGQLDDKQEAEVDRLVKVFEAMKPQDAAARFTLLTDEVRLPIAAKMKERALSAMLAKMTPPEAKRLTEALAARYAAQENAARQAINPAQTPAPAAQAAGAPAQPSAPAQVASAAPPAGAPAAAPPPKPHKPRPAHRPPPAAPGSAAPAQAASKPAKPPANVQASAQPAAQSAPSSAPPAAKPTSSTPAPSSAPAPPAPSAPAKPG